jgi:sucrose phosphorylase
VRPRNAVTVLDTHDGIGVLDAAGDRKGRAGLLSSSEIERLVNTIHERSGGESRHASGSAASNLDTHQINCTFYDALGRRDDEHLAARALQCFVPGIPQIYYVGLLGGCNDMTLVRRTGVGRDINRHHYEPGEVEDQLKRPVVQSQIALLKFRKTHPAFGGAFDMKCAARDRVVMAWTLGSHWATLDVDLASMTTTITCSRPDAGPEGVLVWP